MTFTEFASTFTDRSDRILIVLFFLLVIAVITSSIIPLFLFAFVFVMWIVIAELIINSLKRITSDSVWPQEPWTVEGKSTNKYLYYRLRGFNVYDVEIPYKAYNKDCPQRPFIGTLISMKDYKEYDEISGFSYHRLMREPLVFIERWD